MNTKIIAWIASILFWILALPATLFISGWSLKTLWNWFVIPTFNAPSLSVHSAIGVMIVVSFLTMGISRFIRHELNKNKASLESAWNNYIAGVLAPLFMLLYGWIWHTLGWFM